MPKTSALAGLAAAALLLGGCAVVDPHGILARRFPADPAAQDGPVPAAPGASLGREARLAALDFVWNTINERYYDPKMNGVDWRAARARWEPRLLADGDDEAFWDDLDRMTGELQDAHTRVESPRRARLIENDQAVSLGFSFLPLENRLVVTGAPASGEAWWAGVRPGMTFAEIDGRPALAAYAAALAQSRKSSTPQARHRSAARRLLDGEAGTKIALAFTRGDGTRLAATLRRERIDTPASVSHRILPSGFGYIRLSSWDHAVERRMVRAIEALKATPGLVIDLRANPGGSAAMVRDVTEHFVQGKIAAGRSITRTGKPVTLAAIELVKLRPELEGKGTYAGPLAILVNEGSASGSELFAGLLQALGRATVVGRTTCGCLLAFLGYAEIPGGGKLAYSEVAFEFPNGKRIEGEGVVPDIPVPITVADLLANRDRALEAAQEVLAGQRGAIAADGR